MSSLLQELSRRYPHVRPPREEREPTSQPIPFNRPFAPQIDFLRNYGISDATLFAATIAARCGVSSEQALLGEGLMREESYYRALARHLNAPYYCGEMAISPDAIPAKAVASGIMPLAPNDLGLRAVLAPRGEAIAFLLAAAREGQLSASFLICSPQRMASLLRARMGRSLAVEAASTLEPIDPALSARTGASRGQIVGACAALALSIALWLLAPTALTLLASIILWIIFAAAVALRLIAMAANRAPRSAPPVADANLPVYSVIVPLYHEAAGIPRLIEALDYPRAKLDIKLVVEQRDVETLKAIARLRLPARYDIVVAPPGSPSTKPRALNVALPFARGDYVVVYDAEDTPAPGQLRAAAARFADDRSVDCLQARLAIDNLDDCSLTKMFAIEYCVLFDIINPGLAALGAPLPLGGTSNHFRTPVLRGVGGWDAWNVTEDADLGFRLALFGRRVGALDSDTYEEAPGELKAWLAQRTRWLKGWMQTLIVHSRQPRRMIERVGPVHAMAAMILMSSTVLSSLFGPLLLAAALWRTFGAPWFGPSDPLDVWSAIITLLLLISGSQATLIGAFIALGNRRLGRLYRMLPRFLAYHALIPIAAWLAVIELARRPFHWAKTEHGRSRTTVRPSLADGAPGTAAFAD